MLEEFENYYQRFEKASIARRLLASLIDFIIYYLVGLVLGLLFDAQNEGVFSYHLEGIPALIIFCALFFLWPISEGVWGQTIGKRCLEIKVVAKNNEPISLGQAFGRFFLGFVDFVFLLGIIVAAVNKNNQRIGDAAAGTFVVKSTHNG